MNKKLIALAIATAFAAPVAMADSGNVVIYGVANMSVDFVDGGSGTANSAERRNRVSSNNSHIGFKGSEDLGNGLSAIWQIENAIAMDQQSINDNGASDTAGGQSRRNTFAGLSSKTMGALTFGVQDSPLKTSTGKLDLFGNTLADYRTMILPSVRAQSSVLYASPSFNGLSAKVQYGAQNEGGNGASANPSFWSANGVYENGPIFATVAHEVNKAVTQAVAAVAGAASPFVQGVAAVAATDTKQTTSRVGFGYNFGDAKVGAVYNTTKTFNNVAATETKINTWMLNAAYKMGSNTLKAQYLKSGDTKQATMIDNGASQISVGVYHAMSKRTSVYALYTKMNNDSVSSRALAGGSTGVAGVSVAAAGQDPRGISVGMVHSF